MPLNYDPPAESLVKSRFLLTGWAGLALAALALLGSLAVSLTIGSVSFSLGEIWTALVSSEGGGLRREIIVNVRAPRILAAVLTGGGLALCGVVMQAVVRNPLADPYLMGVSAGASLGAGVCILILGPGSTIGLPGSAFLGALASVVLVLGLSLRSQGSQHGMILGGIAINVLCSSVGSLLIYVGDDPNLLQALVYWLMGSLAPAGWSTLIWPALAVISGTVFFLTQGRNLNLVMLGDDEARSLGLSAKRYRRLCLLLTALMTSSCVAYFGLIGFVGVIIPHSTRFLVGGSHLKLVPFSFLAGGVFMVWIDLAARSLAASEIPLGVITGLLGAPFFFWLLAQRPTRT
ncbi:MAG: iron ABC transporter permease [Deltaproteobacteria bacterium]|jgi:iron complex transport system permease protein|nr:iron ABC transporter permease [Deltaproteobacteria bacterium]